MKPSAGESRAGKTGRPVSVGAFGRVTGLPVTWACYALWGAERQAPRSPRWTDQVPPTQLRTREARSQQRQRARSREQGSFWPRTPAPGRPRCLGGSCGHPGWSTLSLSATLGSKLSWSNTGGWLKAPHPAPPTTQLTPTDAHIHRAFVLQTWGAGETPWPTSLEFHLFQTFW